MGFPRGGRTLAALSRAEELRAGHSPDDLDAIGGLFGFPVAKQRYYAAGAYVCVDGEESRAQREATAALELYETGDPVHRSFSDEAGSRADWPSPA
jgi:hypothetical protein